VKGVVTAYSELTPMAVEIKKVHQFIKTSLESNYKININNSYFFRTVDNVQLNWELVEDGKIVEKGVIANFSIAPRESIKLDLPVKTKQKTGKEYFLNVHYLLKEAEPFLEKGYEVAYDQFSISGLPTQKVTVLPKGSLTSSKAGNSFKISGKNFTIEFDATNGVLKSYVLKGQQLLQQGPQPSFWRAPTDNDIGAGFNSKLRAWRSAYHDGKLQDAGIIENADGSCTITFRKELLKGDAIQVQQFTVFADGAVKVDNKFTAVKGNHPLLMRFGNDLQMDKQFGNIEWYGRGPGENYWDRKSASLIGLYKQTLKQQYFPYARPQESGNKTDVRWVQFTNAKGRGLQFSFTDSLLSFSALPYSLDDLDPEVNKKQYHSGELNERDQIYVHIDLLQTGLQGIDSWGAWPLEKYRIPYKDHQYSYWIKPL
jgi:beta-galactosidase